MKLFTLSLLLPLIHTSTAVRIPFHVQITDKPTGSLTRRAIDVGNTGNAQYVANITIAGNQVPVLLDSGSSDLWVNFESPPANQNTMVDSGKKVELAYAIGRASGNAHRTKIEFGGYAIDDQAFLLVTDPSGFTNGDFHAQGYDGLFGFGPNSGSVVRKKLDKKNADTVIQNIFNRAGMSDNYVTFLLDRQKDPSQALTGEMTIGEILPGWENITKAEKLDVETVTRLLKSDQHWQALTDKDRGVTGPDGKIIPIDSIVPRAPDGQLVAVIDSGFTFSQVPREMADAIYGRVPGAVYNTQNEWWLVPCGQYINIAINFGGVSYPVHPLDTVDDNFSQIDGSGKKVCIGSFQPITSAFSLLGHYDMILGMNFLRSVYTLLNFGSWIDGDKSKTKDVHPYVQMVSHTDVARARRDFVTVRLSGDDTIDTDSRWKLLPADQMQKSPVSDEEKKKKYQEMVLSRWPYIFVGCLATVFIIVGFCIWKCCCRKKKKDTLKGNKNLGFGFGKKQQQQAQEDLYNRGGGFNDNKRDSYLPLDNKYGASTASLNDKPYHDSRSASNLELSNTYNQQPYSANNDYRESAHSGYSQQGYAQGQGGYNNYSNQYSPQPQQGFAGHQGYGGQQGYDYGYQAR